MPPRIPVHLIRRAFQSDAYKYSLGTANSAEIDHFSKLSAYWWDAQGEFKYLHRMNPVRVQFVREKLLEIARDDQSDGSEVQETNIIRGLDVLDVGCGGGLLSESLARIGANTIGIDASKSNIAIAKHHAAADPKLSKLTYLHGTAESLLTEPKRFDVVCSMEVIEHVDNPTMFLNTCADLLKPGGHLFLSTIARTPLAYFLTILMAEQVLQQVSKGTHTYSKFVSPAELVSFFQKRPVPWISPASPTNEPRRTEAEIRGLIYNPLLSKWIFAPRGAWGATDCNYLFWVRKPSTPIPS
ncbi:S-adenosyl-L-methionine-dependent methyltransferase [Infundibulicybe gibba]|nr:S-adenosyl-L-methionine-dependent methyltransferase [Infundibulicybe gibba]